MRWCPIFLVPIVALSGGCGTAILGSDQAEESEERDRRNQQAAQTWLTQTVLLRAADATLSRTRAEFGLRVDITRDGESPVSSENGPPLPMHVDRNTVRAYVEDLREQVEQEAQPGSVDVESRTVVPHQMGRVMNLDEAESAFVEALLRGEEEIAIPVAETQPETGLVPEGLSLQQVVGEYTTRFRQWGSYRGRGRNVRTAGEKLNGAIIEAGGSISFNERVGPRTYREGFRRAPVILRGEVVQDWGGGVCQVSSTLHGAGFFGGLDMEQHTAHSRPSSYIPVGLDATVVWPDVDFVMRNPFGFPIYVHVFVEENEFTVQLLGAESPRRVEYERSIGQWRSHDEREIEDPDRPYGEEEVTENGIAGRTVYRTRTLTEGTRQWVEEDEVVYPPTDRITRIGVGPVAEPVVAEESSAALSGVAPPVP